MNNLLRQYLDINGLTKEDVYFKIEDRLNYGGYKLLSNKTSDDIIKYDKDDFIKIFNNLYSTQRKSVYNDLVEIVNFSEDSGLSFLKGVINKFINREYIDIEEMHYNTRKDIKHYSRNIGRRIKFGKGTISQIAHFCKPEKYPVYNTKSKEVISYICDTNVIEENIIEFTKCADDIVKEMKSILESNFKDEEFFDYVYKYRYVLLDDFVEFAYEIIKE